MSDFLADLRYAVRSLAKNPAFAVVALLTLTLGLGATTAIYAVVDGVLLRPLPYPDADRLVRIWHHNARNDADEGVAYDTYRELAGAVPTVDKVAGISPRWSMTVRTVTEPERVQSYWVSASFFDLLGIRPALGRGFVAEEDSPTGPAVAVLGWNYWQRGFGGDSSVLGTMLTVNEQAAVVVGVMPADFHWTEEVDLWVPLAQNPLVSRPRQVRWVDVVARVTPGTAPEVAGRDVAGFMQRLQAQYPAEHEGLGSTVRTLYDATVGDVRLALWTLLGGAVCVLLIACANIGNLLLARGASRRGEMAVRTALGAGRGRLVRQLLTESAALSVVGALLGAGLAAWLLSLFRAVGPMDLPRVHEIRLDLRVLLIAVAMALTIGVIFGVGPALAAARGRLHGHLQEGARAGSRGQRLRTGLTVAEVALAMVLLAGAGLLLRSFDRLMAVEPGFDPKGVLTLQLAVPARYDAPARTALYDRLFEELEALPGVEVAGGVTRLPLGSQVSTRLEIQGRAAAEGSQPEVEFRRANSGYFDALRIPVLRGSRFTPREAATAPGTMLISQSAADRFWLGEDPVGHRVRFWFAGITADVPWLEVVGVVGDVRAFGLDAAAPPIVYVPFAQGPPASPLLAMRTTGTPADLATSVRERILSIDPSIVIWDVRPMTDLVSGSVAARRFQLALTGLFSLLALTLAAIGIYGVIAYGVRRRTREFGVRMALGAAERDVVRLVVGQGIRLTLLGLGIGLGAALALSRVLRGLLYGVGPNDPLALGASGLMLAVVALTASWLPSRRAARVDPVVALREE